MKSSLLAWFLIVANRCHGIRLDPLENNDKLQDISNQYVAEWQWESWPIKQESAKQVGRSPGARMNVALWKDTSGPNWYLFGGHPIDAEFKKIYSDVWKYSVMTRTWERFFPSQAEVKGTNAAKIGGMMTLRANLFDEGRGPVSQQGNFNVILCGGVAKTNSTKIKKPNVWKNFTRRKKQEEEKKELRSLAVYAPKTTKSNTVWQIDLKDKLWTAYVCCCDTSNSEKKITSEKPIRFKEKSPSKLTNETSGLVAEENVDGNEKQSLGPNRETNKTGSEVNDERKNDSETKKKRINRKKTGGNNGKRSSEVEKRSDDRKKNETISGQLETVEISNVTNEAKNNTKPIAKNKKEKYDLKMKETTFPVANETIHSSDKISGENNEQVFEPKIASKYCPEFTEGIEPVTWCDGDSEVLVTADITSPRIVLWIFNLKTSHWSQKAVKVSEGVHWPGCSGVDSIRYAGNEAEVYVICDSADEEKDLKRNPSKETTAIKIVYRINYKSQTLDSLGKIELGSHFRSPDGRETWRNETKSLLQIVRTPANETILLLAYLDSVDLWFLVKNERGKSRFESVEKIWRGSALKWFDKYDGALYNFQFASETGNPETILVPNPRIVGRNDYWPRDRGRFIVRIFKNENFKNRTIENRTRDQNLTYDLLRSDDKPSGIETQIDHSYSFKALIFFGISLAIFTIFGLILFLKRCVTCPPKIRTRNDCHKSPLVIRYSVIPDDLLYPVA